MTAIGTTQNQMRWSAPSGMTGLPVAIERVQKWCRLRDENETKARDLRDFILAAMEFVERETARQLLTATYTVYLDTFENEIEIADKLPIATVDSIKYYTDDVLTTLSTDDYETSVTSPNKPARIRPVSTATWPTTDTRYDAIQIGLTAGYGDIDDIPESGKAAIKYLCSHMNEFRAPVIVGATIAEMPLTLASAIAKLDWGHYP